MTPLHMISFLVSLAVVDRQQRQWRLSQHTPGSESIWFRLTHWSWHGPEPYQDSRDSTWKRNDGAAPYLGPTAPSQGWYTQKKHRAMAQLSISDALDMRKRVVFALLAWAFVVLYAIIFATRRIYGWLSKS